MNGMIMNIKNKALHNWLPYYLVDSILLNRREYTQSVKHVMVCLVDHYEPFNSGVDKDTAEKRVLTWADRYPRMADKHKDADGKPPQHTWFYPPHLDQRFLRDLVILCKQGYGEIEMHLHHNHMTPFPDTSETLRKKIEECIAAYSTHGIFCLPDGRKRFGFIHGDWSLDNSRGAEFCGVNDEILILKELGCYADFTFPSLGVSQPSMINRMYYVKDDPLRPKSYNRGHELIVGGKPWGDLLLVQGIIGLRWNSRKRLFIPSIEASNIGNSDIPSPDRIDFLVKNAIRIKGRPEWLFIKLHTHGCREVDYDSLLGFSADRMYSYLEKKYNDHERYQLHYVTSREMYNIIKAAESGKDGNPNAYRDFEIPRYTYL